MRRRAKTALAGNRARLGEGLLGGRERERVLAARIAEADKDAFADVYDHAAGPVYRMVLASTRDTSAAEAITQDVFFDAWRHPTRLLAAAAETGGVSAHLVLDAFRRITAWHDMYDADGA